VKLSLLQIVLVFIQKAKLALYRFLSDYKRAAFLYRYAYRWVDK